MQVLAGNNLNTAIANCSPVSASATFPLHLFPSVVSPLFPTLREGSYLSPVCGIIIINNNNNNNNNIICTFLSRRT